MLFRSSSFMWSPPTSDSTKIRTLEVIVLTRKSSNQPSTKSQPLNQSDNAPRSPRTDAIHAPSKVSNRTIDSESSPALSISAALATAILSRDARREHFSIGGRISACSPSASGLGNRRGLWQKKRRVSTEYAFPSHRRMPRGAHPISPLRNSTP